MSNITLDSLPNKSGTVSGSGIIHYRESGVDYKLTITNLLSKISSQYQTFMQTFLLTADKAAARAALDIARRTTVSNADYTIVATDKYVSQITTLTANRTFTLPAASAYPAGEELVVSDQSFSASKQFPITVSRAGSDVFHDGSTSVNIDFKGGILRLISDGTSKWTILELGNVFAPLNLTGRNAIINGDFNVWQRNTSFTSVADATYTADRWLYNKNGTMVHDISRSTDVPTLAQAGRLFNYSMLVDCQTVHSSIGAGNLAVVQQRIEGYNFAPLAQRIITVSFWVKSTKTGTFCVSLGNESPFDRSVVKEYTINASDTWEYKTLTFPASPSAGTWSYTSGIGLRLTFALAVGSTYQTTADAWQTGNFHATSNQVNACDNTANNFRLCGVQLEAGSVATAFEQRTFQQELALCQRYFEKSYEYATPIESITELGKVIWANQNAQTNWVTVYFKVAKRTTPTVTISNPVAAGASIRNYTATTNIAFSVGDASQNGFSVKPASNQSLSDLGCQWYISAEL